MRNQSITRKRTGSVRRRAGALIVCASMLVLALILIIQPVQALAYYFAVPVNTVDVYINDDGTVSLDYYYVFENQRSGEPIEYVDIGMPTKDYDIGNVKATLNGQPVYRVEDSTEVNGIALNLGSQAIPPGQKGEVRAFIPTVRGMLFKAREQESEPYASFQFQPNFFGSQYVTGQTDMTVTLHLPAGLNEKEPRYFTPERWPGSDAPDEIGFDAQNRVYYRWHANNANISAQYIFGSSFPARVVPAAALLTEVPFRLDFEALCPALICLGFAGFMVFTIYAAVTGDRKRRLQYLPPRISVEGNGIKRGLTAVEAAILMQQPMDKILTMVLFSVVKKGAATVASRSPMKIDVTQPIPEGLQPYEVGFLQAMANQQPAAQRRGLQDMMTSLVKSVSEKMRGFSRKETVAYYQDIMTKAWQQVEQAQTPEMKMQMYDEAMDWTMLDRNFEDRTRGTFGPRPVILPGWWGRYDPTYRPASTGPVSTGSSIPSAGNRPPQGVSLPNLPGSDFAGSMVTGMQSFAAGVVGDLTAFTGGVTEKTNPVPKPPPSSGRSGGGGGGGHSCACACACAGCACACAGGGR